VIRTGQTDKSVVKLTFAKRVRPNWRGSVVRQVRSNSWPGIETSGIGRWNDAMPRRSMPSAKPATPRGSNSWGLDQRDDGGGAPFVDGVEIGFEVAVPGGRGVFLTGAEGDAERAGRAGRVEFGDLYGVGRAGAGGHASTIRAVRARCMTAGICGANASREN
jgi:hypothetical protein